MKHQRSLAALASFVGNQREFCFEAFGPLTIPFESIYHDLKKKTHTGKALKGEETNGESERVIICQSVPYCLLP